MHDDREITERRLYRFLRQRIEPAVHGQRWPVAVTGWDVPGEPVPAAEAIAATAAYTERTPGTPWGTPWSTTWLHLTADLPDGEPLDDLALVVDLGFTGDGPGFQCEALAWRPDGTVLTGVSPRGNVIPGRLLDPGGTGAGVDLYIEAAANPDLTQGWTFQPTPLGDPATAPATPRYVLGDVALVRVHHEVEELYRDCWVLNGLMAELPVESPRRHEILRATEAMMDAMDPDDVPGTAAEGRATLRDVLARPASASAHHLVATGHAHIDSAWLWPVRETVRKCARTFANALTLMDEDPDFVFVASSAQQYAWIKEHYPDLFERIRVRVAEGRFVPVGGMWVEADSTMPGGEAMARQFIEGKRFFLDEFGVDGQEAWLPDSFGYSAAMPQIVAAAGMRWFLTQKISWNQTNAFPHHSFLWEGLDGTRLFTHFPPVDMYNAQLLASEVTHAERNFRDKGRATVSLVPFGYGDGGGGPNRLMLAAAHRWRSLEGAPSLEIGTPASFFTRAEAEYASPPVWVGELYLEKHRATFTSQHRTKQGNRRCEGLLHEAELWSATATVRTGAPYPGPELDRLWRMVLLLQFHDILPGSSIAWVHQDAERNHDAVAAACEELIATALAALAPHPPPARPARSSIDAHDGPGSGPDRASIDDLAEGRGTTAGGGGMWFNATGFPVRGIAPFAAGTPGPAGPAATATAQDGGAVLDNGLLRAVVDARGLVVSLRDAATGREAIAPGGRGNLLSLHRDTPNEWDAWDLDGFYRNTVRELTDADAVTVEADGTGPAAVVVDRTVGATRIRQRLVLEPGEPFLRIEHDIDWQEHEKLLKLGFDLDLRADVSSAETQFGHVQRPTHTNTSWDAARFEICAHRWLHVGEPGYGVAIGNDSSYGHDVTRTVRPDGGTTTVPRVSLLTSAVFPDPFADRGRQRLTVTVAPGAGIPAAVRLGQATAGLVRPGPAGAAVEPLVALDGDGVVIDAVKLALDGSGDVIVRLHEAHGARSTGVLRPGFACTAVEATDLLERPVAPRRGVTVEGTTVTVIADPFTLVTLRFRRA
ncbi:putative glycosyl hydrolase [Tersicoccus solisilvae]|uniref:Glycosyl hydrolase n=1 Tax=Tersicoccus solisilvae TaxID=1882339 RepID=A0ABQ1P1U7_9MICC|nr:alpha-mannosidase [Tersicoccus solisilvae]GGC89524.1 putative glycosyl hydrolase [Tersicoccus solisilvae]